MKTKAFLFLLILFPLFSKAQSCYITSLRPKQFEKFKELPTVILLEDENNKKWIPVKEIFKKHWKLTKFYFADTKEKDKYTYKKDNSVFYLKSMPGNASNCLRSNAWTLESQNRSGVGTSNMASIYLDNDCSNCSIELFELAIKNINEEFSKYSEELYNEILFGKKPRNTDRFNILKEKTLLIPYHIATRAKVNFFGKYERITTDSTEFLREILKEYKYKYKLVSQQEIDKIISETEENIPFMNFSISGMNVNIIIQESKSGKDIYYKPRNTCNTPVLKMNLIPKDFKELTEMIEETGKK